MQYCAYTHIYLNTTRKLLRTADLTYFTYSDSTNIDLKDFSVNLHNPFLPVFFGCYMLISSDTHTPTAQLLICGYGHY